MTESNPAHRQTYSPSQIQAYYSRIQLPAASRCIDISSIANAESELKLLTQLQKHQLANIPFENLELHYSSHHTISLDPQHLFHKIVERDTGRGGYCMENNCLFGTILRSLGFDIVSIGAKVHEAVSGGDKGTKYGGWNHMLNIVTIGGKRYLVDVGFGSSGPTHPLPLVDNEIAINVGEQEMRLIHSTIPDFTRPSQKLWIYQHRHAPSQEDWLPTYSFSELEFTPSDFLVMNYFTSTHPSSWFTYRVVCVKMIMDDEGEIVGDVTLFGDEVKRRLKGESELLAKLETEEERCKALDEFLGVKLSSTERNGIQGMVTELI